MAFRSPAPHRRSSGNIGNKLTKGGKPNKYTPHAGAKQIGPPSKHGKLQEDANKLADDMIKLGGERLAETGHPPALVSIALTFAVAKITNCQDNPLSAFGAFVMGLSSAMEPDEESKA